MNQAALSLVRVPLLLEEIKEQLSLFKVNQAVLSLVVLDKYFQYAPLLHLLTIFVQQIYIYPPTNMFRCSHLL